MLEDHRKNQQGKLLPADPEPPESEDQGDNKSDAGDKKKGHLPEGAESVEKANECSRRIYGKRTQVYAITRRLKIG